jgi:hypothetical protein
MDCSEQLELKAWPRVGVGVTSRRGGLPSSSGVIPWSFHHSARPIVLFQGSATPVAPRTKPALGRLAPPSGCAATQTGLASRHRPGSSLLHLSAKQRKKPSGGISDLLGLTQPSRSSPFLLPHHLNLRHCIRLLQHDRCDRGRLPLFCLHRRSTIGGVPSPLIYTTHPANPPPAGS